MRRLALFFVPVALAACAAQTAGPLAPIAQEQFAAGPALDASSARRTVVDFVHAYASSPTEGVGKLANLVAGSPLAAWVRWLDVQHREFTGSIRAVADIRDVEFVATIEARRAMGAQVDLSASVTFAFAPDDAPAFERARILDGPVTLVRTATGTYRVLDLLRDGVLMSNGIQIFPEETRSEGALTVRLDSLFMFPPNWQFNVVIENTGDEDALIDRESVALFVRQSGGGFGRIEGVVTGSLATVPAGGVVDGILAYPMQDDEDGRVLSLGYRDGRDVLLFEFPLDDLVNVVPPPPPTDQA